MTELLDRAPYGERDQPLFLAELNRLTRHHRAGCPAYARILEGTGDAPTVEQAPFVHVGLFKHLDLRTVAAGVVHQRTLLSSATSGGGSSQIALDARSSELQSRSVVSILRDFVGPEPRPLLVLDSAASLRRRGQLSARVAAAMSLRPFATELKFLLADPDDPESIDWEAVVGAARHPAGLLVYGFTWILWRAWGAIDLPPAVRAALAGKRIHFVHSGGWKKLEALQVSPEILRSRLLAGLAHGSAVVDYYGLVEQVGVIYPLCTHGLRHVPVWADVLVRDPHTLQALDTEAGALQLLNLLAQGAPYHSVLTEDLGRLVPGDCPCGRRGKRFELLGRIPRAETRGCANV